MEHKAKDTARTPFSPTHDYDFAGLSVRHTQYFPVLAIRKQALLSSFPSVAEKQIYLVMRRTGK